MSCDSVKVAVVLPHCLFKLHHAHVCHSACRFVSLCLHCSYMHASVHECSEVSDAYGWFFCHTSVHVQLPAISLQRLKDGEWRRRWEKSEESRTFLKKRTETEWWHHSVDVIREEELPEKEETAKGRMEGMERSGLRGGCVAEDKLADSARSNQSLTEFDSHPHTCW